jgi:hypothetical protein
MIDTGLDGQYAASSEFSAPGALAFGKVYERDGLAVLPVTAVRRHTANRDGKPARRPWLAAAMSGERPLGVLVMSEGSVRWRPLLAARCHQAPSDSRGSSGYRGDR